MARRKKQKVSVGKIILFLIVLIILGVISYFGKPYFEKFLEDYLDDEHNSGGNGTVVSGELSIHFLELGNKYTGDCVYIKAGDTDILIDAGSRGNSADDIALYLEDYVTDNTLEYLIATHAHQDHIAGFVGTSTVPGIFDSFICDIIIDFPMTKLC